MLIFPEKNKCYTQPTMDTFEKETLQKKILARHELYLLQSSRLQRVLKDPLRTLTYYVMQYIAYIKPYKISAKTLWGDTMSYYLPEAGMVHYYGFWEANLANFFVNFLKEGDIFLDVGAHVGYYSVLASAIVGENGKVIAFEPTPRTFTSLSENAARKNNIQVYNNAVLNEETEIEFYDYGPKYSAFNSFKKRESDAIFFKHEVESFKVKTVAIDAFCNKESVSPTFIKIDAEGSEYLILEAMSNILNKEYPIVTVEVSNDGDLAENSIKSIAILANKGYECFEITTSGHLTQRSTDEIPGYDNLLFVHPSRRSRIESLIR